eukprot:CAMPEP_0201711246 /NCGR_PEP_ID=MMETSP0578-20130828/59040_1 /ASSEMBLY_ACC=CAM_ASM_000663 /TAXON_ID=267565 /ORGANISM="Skeletonema grethea, Strain CCMP 1804" /LENGTH=312 /DNA_ID=CAMNT_0048200297 /DNA_START=414 /DNA_END=1349 /DNA_ORIENTATION=-
MGSTSPLLSTASPALKSLSSHGKTRLRSSDKCRVNSNFDGVGLSLYRRIWSFLLHSSYLSVSKGKFIDFYVVGSIVTTITDGVGLSLYRRIWSFLLHSSYLSVSKGKFIDFYVVGSIITTITILISNNNLSDIHATTDHTKWLPAYLLLMHLVRRFCECMWVQKSVSTSRMHVAGYFLGVIHYLCLPFVFIPIHDELGQDSSSNAVKSFVVFMGCLFFQYQQHRHHVILGDLRSNKTAKSSSTGGANSYRIPKGGWFEFVSCPHYLAEIMIYFMLAILIELQTETTIDQDEESCVLVLSRICKLKHWIVLVW